MTQNDKRHRPLAAGDGARCFRCGRENYNRADPVGSGSAATTLLIQGDHVGRIIDLTNRFFVFLRPPRPLPIVESLGRGTFIAADGASLRSIPSPGGMIGAGVRRLLFTGLRLAATEAPHHASSRSFLASSTEIHHSLLRPSPSERTPYSWPSRPSAVETSVLPRLTPCVSGP